MKELAKLIQIVTKRQQNGNPLLNLKSKSSKQDIKLLHDIQNGKYNPSDKPKGPDPAELRMARTRLRRKLLNHLYFLNYNDPYIKISHRYEQACLDMLHQARILIKEGEYQISEKLLRNALKIAEETEFTTHALAATDLLRLVYTQTGDAVQFRKISAPLSDKRILLQKEQEAENLYYTAKLEINRSVNAKKNFLPQLEQTVIQLESLWKDSRSFTLFDIYYKTNIWLRELTNNFGQIVEITSETEKLLSEEKVNNKRFDERYNKFIKVYAMLRDRQYEQGLKSAATYVEAFNRGSNNWFAFMENYFLLAMHATRYQVATQIMAEVNANPFLANINKAAQERWNLYRAYLYFIHPSPELLRQFKYQSFINELPAYSKDKEGFNVAFLILQFLHFLKQKEVEALLYRIENLKKYSGRHFKDSFSIRSQLFFKLLMIVVKEDLHPERCRRKGQALADKLAATPAPGDAFAEIEIIPYEHLWQEILHMLGSLQQQPLR